MQKFLRAETGSPSESLPADVEAFCQRLGILDDVQTAGALARQDFLRSV